MTQGHGKCPYRSDQSHEAKCAIGFTGSVPAENVSADQKIKKCDQGEADGIEGRRHCRVPLWSDELERRALELDGGVVCQDARFAIRRVMDRSRELDEHRGSVSITPCLSSDRATMSVNYSAADGKTKTRPTGFGRKERIEDVRADGFGYSRARVRDLRDNPPILLPCSPSNSNC